jgi:hypothetical protein
MNFQEERPLRNNAPRIRLLHVGPLSHRYTDTIFSSPPTTGVLEERTRAGAEAAGIVKAAITVDLVKEVASEVIVQNDEAHEPTAHIDAMFPRYSTGGIAKL